jgi:hypothetical protein
MAAFSPLSLNPAPADVWRAALMSSLHQAHRPELADVVRSADLAVHETGLWVRPMDASLNPGWLEAKLFAAALEHGLPVDAIHVLRGGVR